MKEAIQYLLEKAERVPVEETVYAETGQVKLFDPTAGSVVFSALPKKPRNHRLDDLESFVANANRYKNDIPSVYVTDETARAVFNDTDGSPWNDGAFCELNPTPLFSLLECLEGKSPKALVRLLRHELSTATTTPVTLLNIFSGVKFSVESETESKNKVADAAMSRNVKSKVEGTGDIPERCTFTFDGYPHLLAVNTVVDIECSIFTDAERELISIVPLPGQIAAARNEIASIVADYLRDNLDDEYNVFVGVH